MRETVTVNEAILKGKLRVFLPMLPIFLGTIIGSVFLVAIKLVEGWFIAVGFVLGFILAWLYWSFAITKWRIWAFENVRNVHELKRKALRSKLFKEDGSFSQKTEIRNYEQKQKLKQLEKKFLEKDVYHDDFNVPKETVMNYSLIGNLVAFCIGLLLIGITVYSFVTVKEKSVFLLIPFPIGIIVLITTIRQMMSKEPQVILNANGIKLIKKELMEWQYITNDFIESRNAGKHTNYYLVLEYKNKPVEILVNGLDVGTEKIENLLRVYRVRYEKNNPN